MTSIRKRPATIAAITLTLALIAASLGFGSGTGVAGQSGKEKAGKVVAHKSGGKKKGKARGASARFFELGYNGAEPTLGLTKNGHIFYTAADINALNRVDILRSTDKGSTWENISPDLGPENRHAVTLDPYIYVDKWTDRVFTIDLTVACSILSWTDDEGESWLTNPLACGVPVNDHQTLFSGPPVSSPTVGYDNIVYYCWNNIASSECSKSLDGGLTFHATGGPAFTGVATGEGASGFCGGLHGHGVVGEDGTVFLPREYCGLPYVAISKDEGVTWDQVQVADMPASSGSDPSVAVDKKGNIHYTWIAEDRLPYLVSSKNGGKSWTKPVMIAAPGVNEVNLSTIDAGPRGGVAVAYMGTTNSPGEPWENGAYAETTWNGYITVTPKPFAKKPKFLSATVNDPRDPIYRRNCGPGRCGAVFDFIDVVVDSKGTPWAAFVDACALICTDPRGVGNDASKAITGSLFGGPKL